MVMKVLVLKFLKDEFGVMVIEYVIMVLGIVLVIIVVVGLVGDNLGVVFIVVVIGLD